MIAGLRPINVRKSLHEAFAHSSDPVPFNVRHIVSTLGTVAEILDRRGWAIVAIDENGVLFSWPPSRVPGEMHYDDMESSVTLLMVSNSLGVGYVLAGLRTLMSYPELELEDVLGENTRLFDVETHRFSAPPSREHCVTDFSRGLTSPNFSLRP